MSIFLLVGFLFLKTGEPFATQDIAGPTVAGLTGYLGEQLDVGFEPVVMNQPADAVLHVEKQKPAFGIVTAGFFLTYEKALGMQPLLQIRRLGRGGAKMVLVARQDAPDDLMEWSGQSIACALAAEERYLKAVVLAGQLGNEIRFEAVKDVEGAIFDLVEKTDTPFAAVLLEAAQWAFYRDDPELGAALKTIFTSAELPDDLLVGFGAGDEKAAPAADLVQALAAMKETEDGQRILRSVEIGRLDPIDDDRLGAARRLFHGE